MTEIYCKRQMGKSRNKNQVRIIAGEWRGRRLPVADIPGLRPSGDRGRETLFNWLQGLIPGARCLDLFAGSGALGFEAASRGAAAVVMLEKHPRAVRELRHSKQMLEAEQVEIRQADSMCWLRDSPPERFDLVFVDPPFASKLQAPVLALLARTAALKPGGMVYVEAAGREDEIPVAENLRLWRQKRVGEVSLRLFEKTGEN